MATYVISDMHGKFKEFKEMLELIDFSSSDTLYILGDVVDRGEESIPMLQMIYDNSDGRGMNNMLLLKGNHEQMMEEFYFASNDWDAIQAWHQWKRNGGDKTNQEVLQLESDDADKLLNFVKGLPYYFIIEVGGKKFLLTHAAVEIYKGVGLEKSLEHQIKNQDIVWNRDEFYLSKNTSDMIMIHGHTPTVHLTQDENRCGIFYYNDRRRIDIDCGGVFGFQLGCLRLDDMKEFYVNCKGDNR